MLILKNVTIAEPNAGLTLTDIRVKAGRIEAIGACAHTPDGYEVRDMKGAYLMPGWFDLGVYACDPGFEQRETLQSVTAAARAGGFTDIALMPDTQPVIDSKSQVLYILNQSTAQPVRVHPLGALSVNLEGKDMAEMMDMAEAGAVAFTDGAFGTQDAGLLKRCLEYATGFGGRIWNRPHHKSVAGGGFMHEHVMSTSLGLKGLPVLAETLMVQRDLSLQAYTGGNLHIHLISSAESVQLIRAAKALGQKVTCSTSIAHLCLTDDVLASFDSNLKVLPPLRKETDRLALIQGLKDGTIDCVCTDHTPWHQEAKDLEFTYAEFGMTGLETAFSLCCAYLADVFSPQELAQIWSHGPRKVLGLAPILIQEGTELRNVSCFDPHAQWMYNHATLQSKSHNHFKFGSMLKGKACQISLS